MSDEKKYDVEAAEGLARQALRMPITDAVPIYEQLLSSFPTAAKYWKQYAEAQMSVNNDDATKQIFNRCLLNCWHLPLWGCYIRFIRKLNDTKCIQAQEETRKAFEFMLAYLGTDIASGPLWIDYIAFLKSLPAQTPQEESQRMTALRKTYQRAIVIPSHHVEQLWREYENFENSVSRALAKGLISEYQPKYNSARAVYRERKKFVDEIDWNMLAVPPSGSPKEEAQWTAWKKLLAFEKGNPQRVDSVSANKRIEFTYEQCLMFLYHYPDVWYNYAMWYAKAGSIDSANKVFFRAIKALPDTQMLKYAYAELEESRGAIQAAKIVYESLLGDGTNINALSHIQYIRFLRRTEGVEAARKYFLDARKSPACTYHVYVAYAMMAFCHDKDAKIAHNVFEAGLKHFMHEPGYILEYADFLCRMNDDKNIRALFERALSTLPPEESVEVWKRFVQFEQMYGDLASMMKVEQRKKEALSRTGDEGESTLECSLQEVVSRYSFKDLWPCSSKDLDYLARQEFLSKNLNKKSEKPMSAAPPPSSGNVAKSSSKFVQPDLSKMVIYDQQQKPGPVGLLGVSGVGPPDGPPINGGCIPTVSDDIFKTLPPPLVAFASNLPSVDGPSPSVDFVISVCLQSNIPTLSGKGAAPSNKSLAGLVSITNERANKHKITRDGQHGKRKAQDRQDDDESLSVQSQPLPRDVFKIRQMQKARATSSYTGSASYASALSGEFSGSTG